MLDADSTGTLHPDSGELDHIREQRGARRGSGRVEQRSEEHQRKQLPELDPDGQIQERYRRDGGGAREIPEDARRPETRAGRR